jgi:E3 ubiquitin-protein ligase DOA10
MKRRLIFESLRSLPLLPPCRPCLCGGSMARVHLRCLQQWLERRRADPALSESAAFSCEVCKAPYRLHVRERLNLTLEALCSCASLGFYAEFATILVTLAAMVALFYLFAYSQDEVRGTADPHKDRLTSIA